jgi:hypothetical protein
VAQVPTRIDRTTLLLHEHTFSATNYGMELFDALFTGKVNREYQKQVGKAGSDATVRVQLVISDYAKELHALPWERLYHIFGDGETPLAASAQTPFSRFLVTGSGDQSPVAERPLRLLLAIANPDGLPPKLPPSTWPARSRLWPACWPGCGPPWLRPSTCRRSEAQQEPFRSRIRREHGMSNSRRAIRD